MRPACSRRSIGSMESGGESEGSGCRPLDRFCLAPARFAAVVERTGENPIAVARALCSPAGSGYPGHDPEWEHQEWLDTATITQLAHWTRYVLAQARGERLGDEEG